MTAIEILKYLLDKAESEVPDDARMVGLNVPVDIVREIISAQPARPKGKWVKKMLVTETEKYISYDPEWYCDCCGTKYDPHIAKIVNFCYICGADMRGEQDD